MPDAPEYSKLFDPGRDRQPFSRERAFRFGDRAKDNRSVYEYDDHIVMAVNVALAAGRPLLVRGRPGTGKSSLARDVAIKLGWRFYEIVVTSRTQARDLLWTYDSVARLNDAQGRDAKDRVAYVTPGPLWWAFDPDSARRRGLTKQQMEQRKVPELPDAGVAGDPERAVVLIDEIDKADPDVPNDLLLPLGSFEFRLDDGTPVTATAPPLIILTTNEERDLAPAFLRRCVMLALPPPDHKRLVAIGKRHWDKHDQLLDDVAREYLAWLERNGRGPDFASAAEYLDAVAAYSALETTPERLSSAKVASLIFEVKRDGMAW